MAILNYNAMKGLRITSQDDQKEHDPYADCDSVATLFLFWMFWIFKDLTWCESTDGYFSYLYLIKVVVGKGRGCSRNET